MTLILIISFYILLIIFDFLPIIKKGNKKECCLYLTILLFSFCILILYCLNIIVPSPTILIKFVLDSIFKGSVIIW